jgi:hypothetical protein
MSGVDELRAQGPTAVGTTLVFTTRGKQRTGQIVALDPGRSVTLRSIQGGVTADDVYACVQHDKGTRVSLVADSSITGPLRLLGPVIRYAIRQADSGQLRCCAPRRTWRRTAWVGPRISPAPAGPGRARRVSQAHRRFSPHGWPPRGAPIAGPATGRHGCWIWSVNWPGAGGAVHQSSPSDSWDLSVSVGPLMSYGITTAVVWHWQPMWRGQVVPRVTFVLALIAACAVTVLDPRLAVVPLVLLVLGAAEAWFLRRRARAAIAATSPTE